MNAATCKDDTLYHHEDDKLEQDLIVHRDRLEKLLK
jgi:hypothetical protein